MDENTEKWPERRGSPRVTAARGSGAVEEHEENKYRSNSNTEDAGDLVGDTVSHSTMREVIIYITAAKFVVKTHTKKVSWVLCPTEAGDSSERGSM